MEKVACGLRSYNAVKTARDVITVCREVELQFPATEGRGWEGGGIS
jgi:hypothetical protein